MSEAKLTEVLHVFAALCTASKRSAIKQSRVETLHYVIYSFDLDLLNLDLCYGAAMLKQKPQDLSCY